MSGELWWILRHRIRCKMDGLAAGRRGPPKELLTSGEAAALLRVHPNTVRRWVERGILKAYRVGPRRDRRFLRDDVLRLLSANS